MVGQKPTPASTPLRTNPPHPQGHRPAGSPAGAPNRPAAKPNAHVSSLPFWIGLLISVAWVGAVILIVAQSGPAHTFGGLPLVNWAIGVSAIVSPVALVWMVTAYLQRAADIQAVADPLRRQLSLITGESGAAEARIRRFNQAIKEQIELLRTAQSAGQSDLAAIMDRVRQHKTELERFEHASIHQVKEIQEIIRRNMQHVEQLMDDKFTMLRVLDDKLVQNGDSVARQTEAVRDQLSKMLSEIEENSHNVVEALATAARDSRKLADTSRAQETSLLSAAESASETLNTVSSKIDLSVARFLERAGTAREEAERLASALDVQTRSLDEFSNTLPARVSEAESVLRGVADRLYASELLAREQAVQLSEKLSLQVDGLQQFMDRFSGRLMDIDGTLQQRRNDLEGLTQRIGDTTETFVQSWEKSVTDLNDRTSKTLTRFAIVNDETRHSAETVSAHLAKTTEKYEDAATRMRMLSGETNVELKGMVEQVSGYLSQFESLREASAKAGEEVQSRAAAATQNLQYVLERLLGAREATQAIGETLVKDLYKAVDQNEGLITRLNEAAQMSVHALGLATQSLSKQENDLTDQTRAAGATLQNTALQLQQQAQAAEKGLRDQAIGLMALLHETQSQMNATDQRLQGFAARSVPAIQQAIQQLDTNTEQGLQSMGRYGEGLQQQFNNLQQFHSRVSLMGEEMGRVTSDTLTTIAQLNSRFIDVRTVQEDSARQTLIQFAEMADRLQRETSGLDGQTAQAVATLQQAATRVGEQSYQLLQNAENSGAKMQLVTASLQKEATQIQSILQKQADDLGADLSRAEKQFAALGEALKQRTDAAYVLLDRVATHYNEVTRTAAQDMDSRTERLEQVTGQAQGKVEALNATLLQQLSLIGNGMTQLEAQTVQMASSGSKTLQQLTSLNEKFTLTHEAANSNAQKTITRLEECNTAFMRQSNSLGEATQTAVVLVQKAGSALAEQTGKMIETGNQMDQNVRQLTATTSVLADQSAQIRSNMEQQNQRLVSQLTESVSVMDMTNAKLQQSVAAATLGADQASARFNEVTQSASAKLNASQQEMSAVAERAETTLSSLGANITQQTASLSVLGDQLNEQQRLMAIANENQRAQMVDLFDKLGTAHSQASDVAERTIARLAESLNQIQGQLGALSDQSQTAVGNVRAASTGFADQVGLLLQNAQQSEQSARTVLSVTSALQDQARQLRESLQGESERSGEILTGLLGKITAGGTQLRDMSSSTEMALTSLQNSVTQQSGILNSATQQIADRQRSLTVALDAQRDVINGLLNRLAMAQDETASTAERTVARLTEGTQQITKQMEVIGAQAQNTLASVHAAGAGFVDEAGTLGVQAQQAEQQMRAVLSVTAGMQEQARHLRESMQNESARVIEHLNGVIAQLDASASQLKTQSGTAVHAMDQSALQFVALTQTSGAAMQKQAETLAQAADQAEARMTNAGEKIRGHLKLVGEVGDQTEEQARRLADSAEYASGRLLTLRDTMTASDKEGRLMLDSASARIIEIRTALQDELQRLSTMSQDAVQQVTAATQNLATESDTLRANLASSESAVKEAGHSMREEATQLPNVMSRSIAQIENATQSLKDQTQQADGLLVNTADRFISVTTTARTGMVDEMRRISVLAESADQILRQFNLALAEQVSSLKQNKEMMADGQKDLIEKANESITQLTSASNRLVQLRTEATSTAAKLVQEFDALDLRASSTSQRLAMAGETVVKHVEALNEASQRAESQMLGASNGLREQLERIRAGVQGQIDDINRGLMQITAQLERTGNTLRSTTAGTVADVERISQRFDQTSREASTQLTDKTARMRGATEEVAKLLSGFGDQLDVLLDRLSMAGDGIRRQEGDLLGQLQTALSHLGTVSEKLENGRNLTSSVSEQAVARLSTVSDTIQKQMQNLATGSEAAAGIMRGIGQIYGDQTKALNHGVIEAHGQVQTMAKSIDDMQIRTDRLRVALKLQGDELMESLQQILQQLSRTGDALSETVDDVLQQRAADSLKKIG